MENIKHNNLKVRVKKGSNELEIPMTPRTLIGLDEDGTGRNSLKLVEELIEKINKL